MKKFTNVLINILVIASIPILVIFTLTFLKIITPTIVVSGSMEPAISTGSLILNKTTDVTELKVDDVAAFNKKDGVLVTHRVQKINSVDGNPSLREITMKGDANNNIDAATYIQETALTPIVVIPYIGYVLAAVVNNKIALLALGVFAVGIFSITRILIKIKNEKQKDQPR